MIKLRHNIILLFLLLVFSCIFDNSEQSAKDADVTPVPPPPPTDEISEYLEKIFDFNRNFDAYIAKPTDSAKVNQLPLYLNKTAINYLSNHDVDDIKINYQLHCGGGGAPVIASGDFNINPNNIESDVYNLFIDNRTNKTEKCTIDFKIEKPRSIDLTNHLTIVFENKRLSFDSSTMNEKQIFNKGKEYSGKVLVQGLCTDFTDNRGIYLNTKNIDITGINNENINSTPYCVVSGSNNACSFKYIITGDNPEIRAEFDTSNYLPNITPPDMAIFNFPIFCPQDGIKLGSNKVSIPQILSLVYCKANDDGSFTKLSVQLRDVEPSDVTPNQVKNATNIILNNTNILNVDVDVKPNTLNYIDFKHVESNTVSKQWRNMVADFKANLSSDSVSINNLQVIPYFRYFSKYPPQDESKDDITNQTISYQFDSHSLSKDLFFIKPVNTSNGDKIVAYICSGKDLKDKVCSINNTNTGWEISVIPFKNGSAQPPVVISGNDKTININDYDYYQLHVKYGHDITSDQMYYISLGITKSGNTIFGHNPIELHQYMPQYSFKPEIKHLIPAHNSDDIDSSVDKWQNDKHHYNRTYLQVIKNDTNFSSEPVLVGLVNPDDKDIKDNTEFNLYQVTQYVSKNNQSKESIYDLNINNYDISKRCDLNDPSTFANCQCQPNIDNTVDIEKTCTFKAWIKISPTLQKTVELATYKSTIKDGKITKGEEIPNSRIKLIPAHYTDDIEISFVNDYHIAPWLSLARQGSTAPALFIGFTSDFAPIDENTMKIMNFDQDGADESMKDPNKCYLGMTFANGAESVTNAYSTGTIENCNGYRYGELQKFVLYNYKEARYKTELDQQLTDGGTFYADDMSSLVKMNVDGLGSEASYFKYNDNLQILKLYNFPGKNLLGTENHEVVNVPEFQIFSIAPLVYYVGSVYFNNHKRYLISFKSGDISYISQKNEIAGRKHPAYSVLLKNNPNTDEKMQGGSAIEFRTNNVNSIKAEHIAPINSKLTILTYNYHPAGSEQYPIWSHDREDAGYTYYSLNECSDTGCQSPAQNWNFGDAHCYNNAGVWRNGICNNTWRDGRGTRLDLTSTDQRCSVNDVGRDPRPDPGSENQAATLSNQIQMNGTIVTQPLNTTSPQENKDYKLDTSKYGKVCVWTSNFMASNFFHIDTLNRFVKISANGSC